MNDVEWVMENIHRMKVAAFKKGYALSSLYLLLDHTTWVNIKNHPEYWLAINTIDRTLWGLEVITFHHQDVFVDIVVKLGYAQLQDMPELLGEEL